GSTVRLSFAGDGLVAQVLPALSHLLADPVAAPQLAIQIWDAQSTRTRLPARPWADGARGARGEIAGYNDDDIATVFQADFDGLSMFSRRRATALFWVPGASALPAYARAKPLRTILHLWLAGRGQQLAHGAALGTPQGGVLLVGKSGSGKSTTALAALGN